MIPAPTDRKIYKVQNWRIRRAVIIIAVGFSITIIASMSSTHSLREFFVIALIFVPLTIAIAAVFYILHLQFNRTYILDPDNLLVIFNKKEHAVSWASLKLTTISKNNVFLTQIEGHQLLGFTSTGYDDYFDLLKDILARIPDSHYDISSLALVEVNAKAERLFSNPNGLGADGNLKRAYKSFLRGSLFFPRLFHRACRDGNQGAAETLVLINAGSGRWPLVVSVYENDVRQTDDSLVRFCYAYGLFSTGKNDLAKDELIEMRDRGETLGNRVNELLGMLAGHVNR